MQRARLSKRRQLKSEWQQLQLQHTSNPARAVLVEPSGRSSAPSLTILTGAPSSGRVSMRSSTGRMQLQRHRAREPSNDSPCTSRLPHLVLVQPAEPVSALQFLPACRALWPCLVLASRSCTCCAVWPFTLYNTVCVLCIKLCMIAQQQCLYNEYVLL